MIEITLANAVEITSRLAEEAGPEFVYPKVLDDEGFGICKYVREGCPDCIVGKYLHEMGVPLTRLERADTDAFGGGQAAVALINSLKSEGMITASDEAADYLTEVQYRQDGGETWQATVEGAKARRNITT